MTFPLDVERSLTVELVHGSDSFSMMGAVCIPCGILFPPGERQLVAMQDGHELCKQALLVPQDVNNVTVLKVTMLNTTSVAGAQRPFRSCTCCIQVLYNDAALVGVLVACNTAFGSCQAACAAVALVPTP